MSSRSQNLAFFHPSMEVGGAERVVLNLVNGLSNQGHDIDLVLTERSGQLIDQVDPSVRLIELSTPSVPGLGLASSLPALVRYLRLNRPKSLFTAGNHVNFIAILAHKITTSESQLIISEHISPLTNEELGQPKITALKNKIVYKSEKYLYPQADTIVAVSKGTKEDLSRVAQIPQNNINLIYNPVITPDIYEKAKQSSGHPWFNSNSPPVVLSVGSLSPRKDYSTLIQAFKHFYQRQEARLVLIGRDGGMKADLERLIESLELEEVATIQGYVDNPFAYMAEADVFVLSSRWEGFGNVLVEAMACGCPVVATDCPSGPSEILEGGRYGPLTPVGDPKQLSQAIESVINEPTDPESLKSRAKDFDLDNALNQYSKILL